MYLLSIVGARPQFVKVAVVAEAVQQLNKRAGMDIRHTLVHTGQHYDRKMSDLFFQQLGIPDPQHNLEVGSGSHGKQTALMLERTEQVLLEERPDVVIVYGDTNSTVAGSLAAAKLHIPVAHVEAGLRSFNRRMPEEVNRVVTDHLSDILFCPTETAVTNLANEGVTERVFLIGDVMLDAVLQWSKVAKEKSSLVSKLELKPSEYALLTIHRAENTSSAEHLEKVLSSLLDIPHTIVFPVHPRTGEFIKTNPKLERLSRKLVESETIRLIEPVSYLDMLALEDNARIILTDSGGIQKEAYFLGVPCVTLRNETEWVETLTNGWNRLAEPGSGELAAMVEGLWNKNDSYPKSKPDLGSFGGGKAAAEIVDVLISYLAGVEKQSA